MPSTITVPVTARMRPSDHEALRRAARKQGTTVSALIARLVAEARPHLVNP